MKKVLISLEELESLHECWLEDPESPSIQKWFNSQPAAPQWVRVEDGLPDYFQDVFIRHENGIDKAYVIQGTIGRFADFEWGDAGNKRSPFNGVTHWMPIPPLPGVK